MPAGGTVGLVFAPDVQTDEYKLFEMPESMVKTPICCSDFSTPGTTFCGSLFAPSLLHQPAAVLIRS